MEKTKLGTKRLEKGFSQAELSRVSDVKLRTIQQYERGALDVNGAKLCTLLKLCEALDCRLADILDDEETLSKLEKYENR